MFFLFLFYFGSLWLCSSCPVMAHWLSLTVALCHQLLSLAVAFWVDGSPWCPRLPPHESWFHVGHDLCLIHSVLWIWILCLFWIHYWFERLNEIKALTCFWHCSQIPWLSIQDYYRKAQKITKETGFVVFTRHGCTACSPSNSISE